MTNQQALEIYCNLKGVSIATPSFLAQLQPEVRRFLRVFTKAANMVERTGGRMESRQIAALCIALTEDTANDEQNAREYQGPHPSQ